MNNIVYVRFLSVSHTKLRFLPGFSKYLSPFPPCSNLNDQITGVWDNLGITQNIHSDMYYVFDPVSVKKDASICLDKQGAVRYLYTKMTGWRMKVSFIEHARSEYCVL